MIIGLTGTMGSGKGVISEYLREKGFRYISLSDLIREEALARKIPLKRKELQDLGNELRTKYGNDFWAKRALERIKFGERWVVDSIRNLGEIEELRKIDNFLLVGIDAPKEIRFERITKRKRIAQGRTSSDPLDKEEMRKLEERDRGLGEDRSGQQVMACIEEADYRVVNDASLSVLFNKLNEMLGLI